MFWLVALFWGIVAVAVVWVAVQRLNRPKCPACGLSVDRDLDACPYCGVALTGG